MLSPVTLPSRFREFSRKHGLFLRDDTVVAAVSGGVDSMVLLDLLAHMRELRLIVGHFNHALRGGESDGDEAFVESRAREYGVPFRAGTADTAEEAERRGVGIQEAARDLRYEFLLRLRTECAARSIATAHHADDNAETILLHLFRGTGVQGMAGIPVSRNGIVRPLLFAERAEIEEYARSEHLPFRTDSSNAKDGYTRNALRHRILPLLKEVVSPGVVENINRSGDNFRALAAYIKEETRSLLASCLRDRDDRGVHIALPPLMAAPLLLRQHAVLSALEDATGTQGGSERVEAVLGLLENESGTAVTLPGGYEVVRTREEILIRRSAHPEEFSMDVKVGEEYRLAGFRFASRLVEARGPAAGGATEYADAERAGSPTLRLRTWRDGDAFVPLGMTGRKKLSDFFVDEKVPVHRKGRIPILLTAGGEVIWVCGMRLDDRFKITPATRRVLKLEFSSPTDW